MSFEITCGQCGGRLLVEQAGVIVACPMCDAHLSIPETEGEATPVADAAPATEAVSTEAVAAETVSPSPVPAETEFLAGPHPAGEAPTLIVEPPISVAADGVVVLGGEPSSGPTQWISHSSPRLDEFVVPSDEPDDSDLFHPPDDLPDFAAAASDPEEATIELSADHTSQTTETPTQFSRSDVFLPARAEDATVVLPTPVETEERTERFTASPLAMAAASPAVTTPLAAASTAQPASPPVMLSHDVVPRQWFIMTAGYASAVTLALLFVLFVMGGSRQHALESLPDLIPPTDKSGNIGMKRVPPELDVAPGHVLALGESQRFGNVRVTPIKVTRSRIQFEHAFGKAKLNRQSAEAVLKLRLRFENVSADQEFAPLDATLMYKRIFDSKTGKLLALNFLGPESDRRAGGPMHHLYDLPEFSEYVLAGQDLSHALKPGESWETYVPSVEGLTQVDGEWVWRVLFRKGYNPESKRGVTTLIDVRFDGRDVRDET
jgi:hypothetical protein